MKKPLIIFLLLLISSFLSAQEKDSLTQAEKERREQNIQAGNPFKKYGYTPKIATLSKGKYLEWHDLDSIVIIGSVYYNTKTKKITDFVKRDMTNLDAQPLSDIRGRWISPDPLSEEFPSWSPYNFVFNNPLTFTDPTGMAPEHIYELNEKTGDITLKQRTDDNFDTLVAQNGDVIADNIHKAIFNESESINIQENGLTIYDANSNISASLGITMLALSVYTQKEIAWGDYRFNDGDGNPTGNYFIDVMPYAESTYRSVGQQPIAMDGTTFINMYHTHPSFIQKGDLDPISGRISNSNLGSGSASPSDRYITKTSGIIGKHVILGRTGSSILNNSGRDVRTNTYGNSIYKSKQSVKTNLGWKKKF
jgi:hypothetical protein